RRHLARAKRPDPQPDAQRGARHGREQPVAEGRDVVPEAAPAMDGAGAQADRGRGEGRRFLTPQGKAGKGIAPLPGRSPGIAPAPARLAGRDQRVASPTGAGAMATISCSSLQNASGAAFARRGSALAAKLEAM